MATFVTCLYDLAAKEKSDRRSGESYLEYGKLLMQQNINFVIFTEPRFVKTITEYRRGLEDKTKVIAIDFEELDTYKYLNQMKDIKHHVVNNGKEVYTHLYHIVIWQKLYFMERAIKSNFFNSKYFGWLDFGNKYVNSDFPKDNPFNIIEPRIKILRMCYRRYEIKPLHKIYNFNPRMMAGGYFTGDTEHMLWFKSAFEKYLLEALDYGYIVSEEMLFTVITHDYPEKFKFYYGFFADILKHYVIEKNLKYVNMELQYNRNKNHVAESEHAVKTIFPNLKIWKYAPDELHIFLYETYLYGFYHNKEYAIGAVKEYIEQVKFNRRFLEIFLANKKHIIDNFKFIAGEVPEVKILNTIQKDEIDL